VDFLKPDVRVLAGLSSIQCVCVLMLLYYAPDVVRWIRKGEPVRRSQPTEMETPETVCAE
jgi:hypothetical protein